MTAETVDIPMTDEDGRHITDFVLCQDMAAWVTQGPIMERNLERLAESDKGIILYRRLLREQMQIAEDGGDPMNVFRELPPDGGHIAFQGEPGPFGFDPNALDPAIEKELG